jgi:hypothetical protein
VGGAKAISACLTTVGSIDPAKISDALNSLSNDRFAKK